MGTAIVDETVPPPPPEAAAPESVLSGAVFEIDELGPRLIGIESSAEGADGIGRSTGLDVHDPIEIMRILAELDPQLALSFERSYARWMEAQVRPLTSLDVELGPSPLGQRPASLDPSTPATRAGKIDKPQTPQAVESSPKAPRASEHRAEQPPPIRETPRDTATEPKAEPAPRMDPNERRHWERHEALRREVDRIDPQGERGQSLESRVEQLPPHKRRDIENFLWREWVRDEQERKSTLVIGRHGHVWTLGEEEWDKAREAFEKSLERLAVGKTLGGGLMMNLADAAGITDHDVLMNLGQIGSTFEDTAQARAARGGSVRGSVRADAMRGKTKRHGGSGNGKLRPDSKPVRSGSQPKKPIKLDPGQKERLGITDHEVKLLERVAEVFREEMAARNGIKDPGLASVEAHRATQARIVKEYGDSVIVEPGTGVTGPGHKLGDVQAYQPDGRGLMIELKRTTYVRFDGALVTKPINQQEPGQESQTDAFEVLHHQLQTPIVVLDSRGNLYASTRMYDAQAGGGWVKVGGPR